MREQQIAYIDLSRGEIKKKPIPDSLRRKYLGGRGIDVYLLYNHLAPGADPLGPENVLTVSAGLLGGTLAPSSGRCHIGAKSPLTGLIGSSNMGGFFAPELRFAGIDHLVITGKADRPVYLWIDNGDIEIRDASRLWGKDTVETPAMIRSDLDDEEVKTICIGIGGENLVRFANVISGLKNAAGRTGMGCVMGSKNLKAIAVRGRQDLPIAYTEDALRYTEHLLKLMRENPILQEQSRLGTAMFQMMMDLIGKVRNRNLQRNQLVDGQSLYAENIGKFSTGMAACFGCPVHCRHRYQVPEGKHKGQWAEGPEWTTLGALGSEPDCRRMEAVLVGNYLVNKYGIDSLDFGSMFSWAIELYEKGIINETTTGGLKLEWGNEQLMYEMIQLVATRQGFGNVLADGPKRAIEKLGEKTAYYNIHVKGMSWLHTDDRMAPSHALGVATASRGADHLRSRPGSDAHMLPPDQSERLFGFALPGMTGYEGSGKLVRWQELIYAISDALGVCKFQALYMSPSAIGFGEYAQLVRHITGMELSGAELMEAAERICTLERMFNNREGASRKDDLLPERYYTEPTPLGPEGMKNKVIERDKYELLLDEYYGVHGWDKGGVPARETLVKLGLDEEPSHII
jgi:aldehyde:ferredoxin oxidoreductase